MLYEPYSDSNRVDDDRIKTDFHELYQAMNGMPLREMDRITDPVCALCRDHERTVFVEGIKIGILLHLDLWRGEGGYSACSRTYRTIEKQHHPDPRMVLLEIVRVHLLPFARL